MSLPKLSLLNFELPSSYTCEYILTSPRSLKACYKAGIKPVELLYKSRADFLKIEQNEDEVDRLYCEYESDRQKKLANCIKLRNAIIRKENHYKKSSCKKDLSETTNLKETNMTGLADIRGVSPNCTTSGIGTSPELGSSIKDLDNITPRKFESETSLPSVQTEEVELIPPRHFAPFHKRPSSRQRRLPRSGNKKKSSRSKSLDHRLEQLYADPNYRKFKYDQVMKNSIEREVKQHEAQRVQRELDLWLERWQDRVLLEQWLSVNRAQELANRLLGEKLSYLKEKNKCKTINHAYNLNRVKVVEEDRAELLRRQVEWKGRKIEGLMEERERAINESRNRAHSASELNSQLRELTMPETFDRKVQKFSFGSRLLSSCYGCPLHMYSSHIRLG